MAIVGSTINPIVGFILPIIFYWNIIEEIKNFSIRKILIVLLLILLIILMIFSL
jgi:hypothetical protein